MSTIDTEQETSLLQLLTFSLDEESYGVEVAHVREVLEITRITKVPHTQDYMKGIINLRGRVVPVIDLRSKFNLAQQEHGINTAIVVMEIPIGEETTVVGAIADSVQEVITMSPADIDPPPQIGTFVDRKFIHGIGKRDEQFIILLDLEELFDKEELQEIHSSDQE